MPPSSADDPKATGPATTTRPKAHVAGVPKWWRNPFRAKGKVNNEEYA
jgi:hypothetical protein